MWQLKRAESNCAGGSGQQEEGMFPPSLQKEQGSLTC